MAEVPIIREGDWVGLNRSIRKLASLVSRQTESAVDSAITSTAVVLSDATSDVQSAVDSLETLASDTLASLHSYESALSDTTSEVLASLHAYESALSDATSDVQSGVDSLETLASDTYASLLSYESALSDATSDAYSLASNAKSIASTHKANNGSDHSYIDQDVTQAASPAFAGLSVGSATGRTVIESDGTVRFDSNATVFDDLVLPLDFAKTPAANAPNWESFVGNLNAFAYQVNDFQEFTTELLHGYKTGSTFEFHIHGALNATLAGGDETVKFEIEYSIADVNISTGLGDIFPATTPISTEFIVPNGTADLTNIFISIGTDSTGSFEIGATIKGRIRRIPSSGTELVGNMFLTQVGVHYEIDTIGSRTIATK